MKKEVITIYDYFSEYSKEKVDDALSKLSKKDWEILYLKYGADLEKPIYNIELTKNETCKYNILISKIKKILKGEHNTRKQYWNSDMSIYDYFDTYKREEIDTMISKLDDNDKKLLELRCGKNLDKPIKNKMTRREIRQFTYTLVPKMKKMLENLEEYIKYEEFNIYDYFSKYDETRIDEILSKLNLEEKAMLNLRVVYEFGKVKTTEKNYENWFYLMKKIENLLQSDDYFIDVETRRVHKKIYGYFDGFTQEQIDNAISLLEEEDRKLLNLRYNNCLSNPTSVSILSKEQYEYIYHCVVQKIKTRLLKLYSKEKKVRKIKKIYDRFPGYSKEEIDNMIKKLNSVELNLLKLKYGEDLDNPTTDDKMSDEQKRQFDYVVKYRMRRLLMEPDHNVKPSRMGPTGIYAYFSNVPKEKVDSIINSLTELEKGILKLKHSDNLKSSVPNSFLSIDEYKQYTDIISKMKKILAIKKTSENKKRRLLSIYEIFSGYTEEQINYVLNSLNEEEKRLIHLKYGLDLHKPETSMFMTREEKKKIQYTLLVTISKKLEEISRKNRINNIGNKQISKSNVQEIQELISLVHSEKYVDLLKKYRINDVIILILYFVGIHGTNFSMKMISDYLNVDIKVVERVIVNYLFTLKEKSEFMDEQSNELSEGVQYSKSKL